MSFLSDAKRTFWSEWDSDWVLENEPIWAAGLFVVVALLWALAALPFFTIFWIIGATYRRIMKP